MNLMKKIIDRPSPEIVREYLIRWNSLENYVLQESSLRKLFTVTYPSNRDMDDVLIKVCSLNDFYSTNIFSPFFMAKHIVNLNVDERLMNRDLSLVNDIAKVIINGKRQFNFYSFATKYCSHHAPNIYPIYDNYVDQLLMHFKKECKFSIFRKRDLKDYPIYKDILIDFQCHFGLVDFSPKEIDKYLWQAGKQYFPRKY